MIKTVAALPFLFFGYAAHAQSVPANECDYGAAIEQFESGGLAQPYTATNPSSTATGRYQMTYAALIEAGYIDASQSSQPASGAGEWTTVVWTGQGGVNSREEYMASPEAQSGSLEAFTAANLSYIEGTWDSSMSVGGVPLTSGGVGVASHMLGNGGWSTWAASGFTTSGLSAATAAAHGMTLDEFQRHLEERVAAGGCANPGSIAAGDNSLEDGGAPVQDLPEIFLMPWEGRPGSLTLLPGQIRSNIQ